MKVVTFSFDDAVLQDERLVELLNKYNLKCTFNVNSGLYGGLNRPRLDLDTLKRIYNGHEVASHGETHAHLKNLNLDEIRKEIKNDVLNLERDFNEKIVGFAYPYGEFNDDTITALKEANLKYARTVISSFNFLYPSDLYLLKPTCHYRYDGLFKLVEDFLNLDDDNDYLFYIWGHSYELDEDDGWERIEKLFKLISNKKDIKYLTNKEALL